jgi:hypothetical protein
MQALQNFLWRTCLVVAFVGSSVFITFESPEARAPSDRDQQTRELMVKISRQLGVTCNYCHDVTNFRSAKLPTYKIGKEHLKIVDLLNRQGFKGPKAPKADCYMCHRGKAVPDYKETASLEK